MTHVDDCLEKPPLHGQSNDPLGGHLLCVSQSDPQTTAVVMAQPLSYVYRAVFLEYLLLSESAWAFTWILSGVFYGPHLLFLTGTHLHNWTNRDPTP